MTKSAQQFLAAVRMSWDSRDPWEQTAARGLSEIDGDALRDLCEANSDPFAAAESEVLGAVRSHLARTAEVS